MTATKGKPKKSLIQPSPKLASANTENILGAEKQINNTNTIAKIEGFLLNPIDGSGVLYGWVLRDREEIKLLFNLSDGLSIPSTDIVWLVRPDVTAAYPEMRLQNSHPGFIAFMPPGKFERKVFLIASDGHRIVPLASSERTKILPQEPKDASKYLFGIRTELSAFCERVCNIDQKILRPLIEAHNLRYGQSKIKELDIGTPPLDPMISLIIPLYRRFDFLENQIIEFASDSFIRSNAEVVYVIDDPFIVEDVRGLASKMHSLTKFPIRLVWKDMNGGFSLANNFGASRSRAQFLMFLNSDVIPLKQGWLESLLDVIGSDRRIGAVGPRLVFPGGGMQHNGLEFRYDSHLSVWLNDQPLIGIDPGLLPNKQPHPVEAVAGACLLMQRHVFESIGGWESGYLIGDFEDSDLCLTLRSRGLTCFLDPRVTLTHLERQSFAEIGDNSFRTKVALFNAIRHQTKWGAVIEDIHRERTEL